MRVLLASLLVLAYPVLVYFGLLHFEPRSLALLLAVVAVARAAVKRDRMQVLTALAGIALAMFAAVINDAVALKLYPVLVNATLLAWFAHSLRHPPSAIERLARLREPELSPAGIAYTRRVTMVWCGFFVINGSIALATAVWASNALWALYNGLIAYVLIGLLFAGEWLVRRRVRGALAHG